MIRLGLRLSLNGGKEAMLRVFVTAAAVALGVGLLLAALAGVNGLNAQTDRGAWLDSAAQASRPTSTSDGLWWLSSIDQFDRQAIDRVDVAAAGPNAPVPPGISHLPGPGEYYASPALRTLVASQPANELRDRFPGRQIGTIGAVALPSPNSLIIVIGHTTRQLSQAPGAVEVGAIQRTPASCYHCQNPVGSGPVLQWILAGGAVFLLLPVLILIATASRLSAARREERFAAMRLVGATPRQISVVSAVEAVVAALAGVAVGFALFFVFRPLLYHVPFTGAPFRSRRPLTARDRHRAGRDRRPDRRGRVRAVALRRVQISPLGVNRRASSRPPRIVRTRPATRRHRGTRLLRRARQAGQQWWPASRAARGIRAPCRGAGSRWTVVHDRWFPTHGEAGQSPRHAHRRPPAPRQSQSGLPVHQWARDRPIRRQRPDRGAQLHRRRQQLWRRKRGERHPRRTVLQLLDVELSRFRASSFRPRPGACRAPQPRRACVAWRWSTKSRLVSRRTGAGRLGLSRAPSWRRRRRSARALQERRWRVSATSFRTSLGTTRTRRRRPGRPRTYRRRRPRVFLLTRLSSPPTGPRDRSNGCGPRSNGRFPSRDSRSESSRSIRRTRRLLTMIQDMTDVIIVASLIIAACSLAVNIVAGLGERRRPFSLLRLTGVPTKLLHRVVALESALPLLLVAAVSIVVGLVSAALYLHSQVGIAFKHARESRTGRPWSADLRRRSRSSPQRSRS